jgi:hypothetical protein
MQRKIRLHVEKSKGQRFAIVIFEIMFETQPRDIIEVALALNYHYILMVKFLRRFGASKIV